MVTPFTQPRGKGKEREGDEAFDEKRFPPPPNAVAVVLLLLSAGLLLLLLLLVLLLIRRDGLQLGITSTAAAAAG